MSMDDSGGSEQMSVLTQAPVETPIPSAPRPAPTPVPLRRNKNFQLLWAGSSAAFVGLAVADIAYPLVILAMTGSPFKAGLFATVQLIGMMLTMLPAGQLLDRHDRRRLLMAAELTRAAAASLVAVAWYLDALTFWQLMATAAVLGAMQPFGSARMLMVRTVVPTEQLTSALTQEQVRDHGSQLVGPPLGGFLYGVSRALPFVAAAAGMIVSFVCAFFVRMPAPAAKPAEPIAPADPAEPATEAAASSPSPGMFAGLAIVWRDPMMRATSLTLTLINTVGFPLYLALIVMLEKQGQSSTSIGVVMGVMAVGGLAGTLLVKPSHRWLEPGWVMIVACFIFAGCMSGLIFAHTPVLAGVLLFCANLVVPAAIVMIDILILRQVPDEQRGRVNAALQTLMALGMPLGMLIGGAALQYFAPTTVVAVMAAWLGVCAVYALCQRALREARWPDAEPAADAAA